MSLTLIRELLLFKEPCKGGTGHEGGGECDEFEHCNEGTGHEGGRVCVISVNTALLCGHKARVCMHGRMEHQSGDLSGTARS